ncbi:MAG TPA: TIGR00366 family protein [Nocardioidaceae bacterium]|jgi:short-chain fatty acids transporter
MTQPQQDVQQDQAAPSRKTPMQRFTDLCVRYVERFMPDPYLFAVILTLVVVVMIFAFVDGATPGGIVDAWYSGVWGEGNIFAFAMEMVLILVSGYTLAEAPLVKRGLEALASKPRNQVEGAVLTFAVAAVASLLNWGLGLVVGALMARQIAGRLRNANFGYVVAAGYIGYMLWTNGLSSSIALANTDKTSPLNVIYTTTHQTVPLSLTIFQPYSYLTVLVAFVVLAVAIWRMSPTTAPEIDPAVFEAEPAAPQGERTERPATFAERLEGLWILNVVVFLAGAAYFVRSGFELNIGSMVMLFTILGALLHWTPIRFIRAFVAAAKTSGPLLLQYPLYGGIIALLGYTPHAGSKPLQAVIASFMVSGASAATLPFFNYLGSLVISLFVPSGGGHWGVQGPVAVSAAVQLGHSSPEYLGKVSMSVAAGEAVANMIQPFWLLPVLAIARLNVRQVMGYTVAAFVIGLVIFGVTCLVMPFV